MDRSQGVSYCREFRISNFIFSFYSVLCVLYSVFLGSVFAALAAAAGCFPTPIASGSPASLDPDRTPRSWGQKCGGSDTRFWGCAVPSGSLCAGGWIMLLTCCISHLCGAVAASGLGVVSIYDRSIEIRLGTMHGLGGNVVAQCQIGRCLSRRGRQGDLARVGNLGLAVAF